jgi:hypothetical protein
MLGTQTLLGLALDEDGVLAAEVDVRSGRPQVRRSGRLDFGRKLTPDTVKELGQQLRRFLRENHFGSKQAVVGIPAKWVLAKEIVAPPADAETLSGMLSIQAERAFSLNAGDLVFDYYGRTSKTQSSRVLLVASRRELLDRVTDLMTAAGIQVRAVTASALAFAHLLSEQASSCTHGFYIRPDYCEFWSSVDGKPQAIKHVAGGASTGAPGASTLAASLQRLILFASDRQSAGPAQ